MKYTGWVNNNNGVLEFTPLQYEALFNKEIDYICFPFNPDCDVKKPYIWKNENQFTWEYEVLLYNGYKKKNITLEFPLKIDKDNKIKISVYYHRYDTRHIKLKIGEIDCIRPTLENGLSFNHNWYWKININKENE